MTDRREKCSDKLTEQSPQRISNFSGALAIHILHHLTFVEAYNGYGAAKKMKFSKGSHSKDAYMLVYSQRGDGKLSKPRNT